jgi:DEAD/DEAH box helicase domain-containing protein
MRLAVLDLETQKSFRDVGRNKLHELKVSVAGWYEYATDAYLIFEEKEIPQLEERLRQVDLVIGFNIKGFDLPVLEPYLLAAISDIPVFDMLEEIVKVRGHRVTLESLAVGTLASSKSGKGLDAVRFFQEGNLEALKKYCLDDVRITKEVFDYGRANRRVLFKSERDFQIHEVPVAWEDLTPFGKRPSPIQSSLF